MKNLKKGAIEITKVGVIGGVGASVITATGGNASGLSAMGTMMQPLGTTLGASAVLGQLRGLQPKKKHRR